MRIVSKSANNWSTQKYELRSALLAAELTTYLANTFEISLKNCICLSDSQATLYWLNTNPQQLSVFHANNVQIFLKHDIPFRYVNTLYNFADIITKYFSPNHWVTPQTEKEKSNFLNFWLGPYNFSSFDEYKRVPNIEQPESNSADFRATLTGHNDHNFSKGSFYFSNFFPRPLL